MKKISYVAGMGAFAEEQKVASSPYPSVKRRKQLSKRQYTAGPSKEVVTGLEPTGSEGSIQNTTTWTVLNIEVISIFREYLSQQRRF
jgi:hypothetical protein